jgi:hypothetical protein
MEVLMKKTVAVTTFSLTLILTCLNVFAQSPSRENLFKEIKAKIKEIEAKRAELAVLERNVIAVPDTDRKGFAAFLKQPQTGMIRLLPRETYVGSARDVVAINGGGAFYSFVLMTHEYGQGSDISLEQGQLSVGFAGADYGMLLNLGDISLDQVSNHVATRVLLDYTPPIKEPDVRAEFQKFWQGIELKGFNFKSRLPANVSNTYLLRSISPNRSDIAVAFRIVRKDTDDSLILAYKVLKSFPKPTMERKQTAALENH